MKLLTTALVITLLTTTSAKPVSQHQKNYEEDDLWSGFIRLSSFKDSSSSSDQSPALSESSEESSEEVTVTIQTTRPTTTGDMTADPMITSAMTDITTGDGSTFTPDPNTDSTDGPGVTETTPPAGTSTPTSSTSVTHSVTRDIPTAASITENRGDN